MGSQKLIWDSSSTPIRPHKYFEVTRFLQCVVWHSCIPVASPHAFIFLQVMSKYVLSMCDALHVACTLLRSTSVLLRNIACTDTDLHKHCICSHKAKYMLYVCSTCHGRGGEGPLHVLEKYHWLSYGIPESCVWDPSIFSGIPMLLTS